MQALLLCCAGLAGRQNPCQCAWIRLTDETCLARQQRSTPSKPAFGSADPYRPAQTPQRPTMLAKAACAAAPIHAPRCRAFTASTAAARPRALPLAARRQSRAGHRVIAAAATVDTKYPSWEVIYKVSRLLQPLGTRWTAFRYCWRHLKCCATLEIFPQSFATLPRVRRRTSPLPACPH